MTAVRATRQAAAVRDALAGRDGFTSAQDLHAELRRRGGGVGLTTVYRHLQSLADAGAVDVLRTPEGESVYRICDTGDHHHHLVCRVCGRTVEIEGREVERWTRRVADAEGFVDVDHTVEVFGTCADCAGARPIPHGSVRRRMATVGPRTAARDGQRESRAGRTAP